MASCSSEPPTLEQARAGMAVLFDEHGSISAERAMEPIGEGPEVPLWRLRIRVDLYDHCGGTGIDTRRHGVPNTLNFLKLTVQNIIELRMNDACTPDRFRVESVNEPVIDDRGELVGFDVAILANSQGYEREQLFADFSEVATGFEGELAFAIGRYIQPNGYLDCINYAHYLPRPGLPDETRVGVSCEETAK